MYLQQTGTDIDMQIVGASMRVTAHVIANPVRIHR